MDTFRLLSRSSNFKHTNTSAGRTGAASLPSQGASENPQLYGSVGNDAVELSPGFQQTNKKRKRQDESSFNRRLDVDRDDSKKAQKRYSLKDGATDLATEKSLLTESECKAILKEHKLKITRLSFGRDQLHSENQRTPSKARKAIKGFENAESQAKKDPRIFPQPLLAFDDLRTKYAISRRISSNIREEGFSIPTEVQLGSLPLTLQRPMSEYATESMKAMSNNIDLLTIAPTGSGKTLAFMIPLLDGLMRKTKVKPSLDKGDHSEHEDVRAVIIAPTKELAHQIVNEGRKLAKGTGIKIIGMRKNMILKGIDLESLRSTTEELAIDSGSEHDETVPHTSDKQEAVKADILVTTPLSLVHAIQANNKTPKLPSVQHLVLDEADVLLDPLFRTQTLEIWNACTNPSLRVSLWSATMGASIEELAKSTIQTRHLAIEAQHGPTPRADLVRLVVGLKDSAIPNISHKLVYAATEQGKLLGLRQLLHPSPSSSSTPSLRPPFLVFTQTIPRAIALHSELLYDIPPEAGGSSRIAVLHSDLSDTARSTVMTRFRRGEIWILITTDLLSRGVDFRGINGVVNYDVPTSSAAYIHRVGRTGRAGRDGGVAVTLYTKEDIPHVKAVANVIRASEGGKSDGEVRKWLLDALPTPSKELKKKLKRFGVEARRAGPSEKGTKEKNKARISTKSGFDRRIERNRKDAAVHSRRRIEADVAEEEGSESGSEWSGLED